MDDVSIMSPGEIKSWEFISDVLYEQVKYSMTLENSLGLQYIKDYYHLILIPQLESFYGPAFSYQQLRDEYNIKVDYTANQALKELKNHVDPETHLVITSSFKSGLNLIDESDIDISLMIHELDECKLSNVSQILVKLGYEPKDIVNPNEPRSLYHPFVKYLDGIEIEVKVRDLKTSYLLIQLHEYLDKHISLKEKILLTYAKLKLKNLSHIYPSNLGYKCLKKIIYEAYFSKIKNGFMLKLI